MLLCYTISMKRQKVSRQRKRLMLQANAYSRLAAKEFRNGNILMWANYTETADRIKARALRA